MLKILFALLLGVNAVLYGLHAGFFDALVPSGREPVRLQRQLHPERLKIGLPPPALSPAEVTPESAAKVATKATAVAPALVACTEIGNFLASDASRFEARLARLEIPQQPSRREFRDGMNYMVMLPPAGGKEGADRKLLELRGKGITDFFVIQENTPRRWGISLGLFKSEEAANAHAAEMAKKGLGGTRVIVYNAGVVKTVYQLRNLEPQMVTGIERMLSGFPKQEMRACNS
ncbi:MAG: SPOR domain-containing protein [Janthinobacterium lividum]